MSVAMACVRISYILVLPDVLYRLSVSLREARFDKQNKIKLQEKRSNNGNQIVVWQDLFDF